MSHTHHLLLGSSRQEIFDQVFDQGTLSPWTITSVEELARFRHLSERFMFQGLVLDMALDEPVKLWDAFQNAKLQHPESFFVFLPDRPPEETLADESGRGGWTTIHAPFRPEDAGPLLRKPQGPPIVYYSQASNKAPDFLQKAKLLPASSLEQAIKNLTENPSALLAVHVKSADTPLAIFLRQIYQAHPNAKTMILLDDPLEETMRSAVRGDGWAMLPSARGISYLVDHLRASKTSGPGDKPPAERILVVDDESALLSMMVDRLSDQGYEVDGAESGRDGLELMKKNEYHAALVDFQLGDTTGLLLAKELRRIDEELPIILMTAHASLDMAVKAIQADVYDYLIKPVDANHLKRSLNKALEKRRLAKENKALLADLQRANDQLNRLNDLKSKFLSIVSHDLRTPLTSIKGYAQVLTTTAELPEQQKRNFLEVIVKESNHLGMLISDLMDFVSIEAGKLRVEKEPADLKEIIGDTVNRMAPIAAEKKIRFKSELPSKDLPIISADARRLGQVLTNLVGNAFKHTPAEGSVVLSVSLTEDMMRVAVTDTGEGIPPTSLRHVFEQFYQVESHASKRDGIGLGLNISREIVKAHGGEIGVLSDGPGKGAEFWFTLPLPSLQAGGDAPPAAA